MSYLVEKLTAETNQVFVLFGNKFPAYFSYPTNHVIKKDKPLWYIPAVSAEAEQIQTSTNLLFHPQSVVLGNHTKLGADVELTIDVDTSDDQKIIASSAFTAIPNNPRSKSPQEKLRNLFEISVSMSMYKEAARANNFADFSDRCEEIADNMKQWLNQLHADTGLKVSSLKILSVAPAP